MKIINIPNDPNFSLTNVTDGVIYELSFRIFNNLMYCSITINGEQKTVSVPCISHTWLLPYKYLEVNGNFRFECTDPSEYPNYQDFGKSCFLKFYTAEEVAEMANGE